SKISSIGNLEFWRTNQVPISILDSKYLDENDFGIRNLHELPIPDSKSASSWTRLVDDHRVGSATPEYSTSHLFSDLFSGEPSAFSEVSRVDPNPWPSS